MTDITELRRWSAEDLCKFETAPGGYDYLLYNISPNRWIAKGNWQPDNPGTGQIWMVVEKMHNLGFTLRGLSYNPYTKQWTSLFYKFTDVGDFSGDGVADSPCIAILKAAKAAWEADNG